MIKTESGETNGTGKANRPEEMHCTKCGTYLGSYDQGSRGTVPCPKCKEPNVMDYTGEDFVVKRRRRAKA